MFALSPRPPAYRCPLFQSATSTVRVSPDTSCPEKLACGPERALPGDTSGVDLRSAADPAQDYMCKEVSSTSDEIRQEPLAPITVSQESMAEMVPCPVASQDSLMSATIQPDITMEEDDGMPGIKIVSVVSLAAPEPTTKYECKKCGLESTDYDILVAHVSAIHNVHYIYACPYCAFGCSRHKINMYRHIRRAHPTESDSVPIRIIDEEKYIKTVTVPTAPELVEAPETGYQSTQAAAKPAEKSRRKAAATITSRPLDDDVIVVGEGESSPPEPEVDRYRDMERAFVCGVAPQTVARSPMDPEVERALAASLEKSAVAELEMDCENIEEPTLDSVQEEEALVLPTPPPEVLHRPPLQPPRPPPAPRVALTVPASRPPPPRAAPPPYRATLLSLPAPQEEPQDLSVRIERTPPPAHQKAPSHNPLLGLYPTPTSMSPAGPRDFPQPILIAPEPAHQHSDHSRDATFRTPSPAAILPNYTSVIRSSSMSSIPGRSQTPNPSQTAAAMARRPGVIPPSLTSPRALSLQSLQLSSLPSSMVRCASAAPSMALTASSSPLSVRATQSPPVQQTIINRPPSIMPRRMHAPKANVSRSASASPAPSPVPSPAPTSTPKDMPPLIRMTPSMVASLNRGQLRTPPTPLSRPGSADSPTPPPAAHSRPASRQSRVDSDEEDEEKAREKYKIFNVLTRMRTPTPSARPGTPSIPGVSLEQWRQLQLQQHHLASVARLATPRGNPSVNPNLAAMHRLLLQRGINPQLAARGHLPLPRGLPPRPINPGTPILLLCPYCPYEGQDPDSLHDHILSHAPNIHWICPYCPTGTPLPKPEVRRHIETLHPGCRVVYKPYGVPL